MQTESSASQIKASWLNARTFLAILLVLVLGLAIWGAVLTSKIKTTSADQAALQKKYNTLSVEKAAVSDELDSARVDLEKAKTDLEKAKKDLATTQSNITKTKNSVVEYAANIDEALKYIDVAMSYWVRFDTLDELKDNIRTVDDPELTEKFETYFKSGSDDDYDAWMTYLFVKIIELLST